MRKLKPRPSACRRKISAALIARLLRSRSRNLRATEIVRIREFLEWPFFAAAHRELAERIDAWAFDRFGRVGHGSGTHAEDRASVDAACQELVRDLGRAGWTRYSVPSEATPGGLTSAAAGATPGGLTSATAEI